MANERPSTPPPLASTSHSDVFSRSPLTPEQVRKIVGLSNLAAGRKRTRPAISTSDVPSSLRDGRSTDPEKRGRLRPLDDIRPARNFTKFVEFDFSKMTNTKGGFLTVEGSGKAPAPTVIAGRKECGSLEIDWKWEGVFGCTVCNTCKEKVPKKYNLRTKSEASVDYLLMDSELKDNELLPHLERPNPHKATWNNMMLYLRYQGSAEALDAEFAKREKMKKRRKEDKFRLKLYEPKKKTRVEFVDSTADLASEHASRAHSTDRESKRKRDRITGPFKTNKGTVTASQISTSEQSLKSKTSTQVAPDSQANGDGSQSQDLWMSAYKALEIRDPDLVTKYARHLDPARNSSTTPTQSALGVVQQKLQDNEVKILHETVTAKGDTRRMIQVEQKIGNQALNYAVLIKEMMLAGLHCITDLLRLYKIREEIYLQVGDKPALPDFVKAIVELYTDILDYQARVIRYFSHSSAKRGIQSTFEWDDWNGMLARAQNSDTRCTKFSALIDKNKEHRFYTEQSSQIEQSVEVQKRILEMFEAFQVARQQDRQDDQEAGLLGTLASDYKTGKESNPRRVHGTCEWIFEDKRFLEWRSTKRSSLLWISAGSGCGKSMLSRCLIDEKRLCTNVMTSTVCYFFFMDGQEKRFKASNAISAIYHQLFEKKSGSTLLNHAFSSYRSYREKLQTCSASCGTF
ncbi:hypothetical protein MMC22_003537 [Lobaria immixta]|nr:hypothetical protein [Lobaria immixta]